MSVDVCSTVPRLVRWLSAGWSFQASIILSIFWMCGSFAAVLQYKSSPGCCRCDFQFSGRVELPTGLGIVGAAAVGTVWSLSSSAGRRSGSYMNTSYRRASLGAVDSFRKGVGV